MCLSDTLHTVTEELHANEVDNTADDASLFPPYLSSPASPTGGGRGAAKTHLPTNEAALKQLAASHDLPGLVLENR